MITIAETEQFQKKVSRFFNEAEKDDLITYLSNNPNSGDLIRGTGGVRKLRWARVGMGKSGGTRVIYYYHSDMMPLYILTIFGKNEKSNISMQEKSLLVFGGHKMSKAFEEIYAGINEAISHAKGEKTKVIEHTPKPIDVKAVRAKTGMSQQHFCTTFGISLGTLRHWEQGLRTPRGTALVLLRVVDKNPTAVIEAIAG